MSDWFTDDDVAEAVRAYINAGRNSATLIEAMQAALRAVNPFEWRGMESAPKLTPIFARHKTLGRAVIILRDIEMDDLCMTIVASVMFDPRQIRDVASPYMTQTNLEDFDLWTVLPPAPEGN